MIPKGLLAKYLAYLGMVCSVSLKNEETGQEADKRRSGRPKNDLQQINSI